MFQFPTGWNSTTPRNKRHRALQRFNSQRDGILQIINAVIKAELERFNSQRDGILLFLTITLNGCFRFQFPTGWNSTVSLQIACAFSKSFNSQRDGILRFFCKCTCGKSKVSIPNGMEFYQVSVLIN